MLIQSVIDSYIRIQFVAAIAACPQFIGAYHINCICFNPKYININNSHQSNAITLINNDDETHDNYVNIYFCIFDQ